MTYICGEKMAGVFTKNVFGILTGSNDERATATAKAKNFARAARFSLQPVRTRR